MSEILKNRNLRTATGLAGGLLALSTLSGCANERTDNLSYEVICPEGTELVAWSSFEIGGVDIACFTPTNDPDEYRREFSPLGVTYIPKDGEYSQSDLNAFQLDVQFDYLDQSGVDFLNHFNYGYELSDGYVPEEFAAIGDFRKSLIIGNVSINNFEVKEIK